MEKKAGRPRSSKSHQAVLAATQELLGEIGGSKLTIEAIAKRAGVGKPTIYRWWPSLADIVMEALQNQAHNEIPVPEYDSLEKSLSQFLRKSVEVINAGSGAHLKFLMAQAQRDENFGQRFRVNLVEGRRFVLRSLLQNAIERGEIKSDKNLDVLIDMLFGAMWYRLLVGHSVLDYQLADEMTMVILRSIKRE